MYSTYHENRPISDRTNVLRNVFSLSHLCPGGGGGGGHSGTEGGRTFVTYFAEEGVFF